MDQPPKPKRPATSGSFKPGQSGNPAGRTRRTARNDASERRDGWINTAAGHGTARDRRTHTTWGLDIVTDLEAMQLWRTEWLCAKVIETRPKEAFRRGYEIDLDDKQKSEKLATYVEELGVDAAMVQAIEYERAYGGAAILPLMDGALGDLSEPLVETSITEVQALVVFEPRELQVVSRYAYADNPRKLGRPMLYRLTPSDSTRSGLSQQLIHESRLVIFPGIRVSKQTQPGQRDGWGDNELSRPYGLIRDIGLSIGSATTILQNYGRDVLQLEGWAELAAQEGNEGIMSRRLASFDMMNTALRLGVLDAKDTITTRGGQSLSGVDSTLKTQAQFVAAACDIPITVLLGMSPAGLNATGDMDVRNWYATIENDQSSKYRPRLEQLIRFLILSSAGPLGGKEPEVWSVKFRPLWTPSEKETAETRKLDADRAGILIDKGVASADDVAKSFYGGDTYSSEISIDWKAREAQKKIDEERATDLDAAAIEAMGRQPVARKGGAPVEDEPAPNDPPEPDKAA